MSLFPHNNFDNSSCNKFNMVIFLLSFLYQAAIFPPENQVSPVADQLRKVLSTAPWARVGLGLPVVSVEGKHAPCTVNRVVMGHTFTYSSPCINF